MSPRCPFSDPAVFLLRFHGITDQPVIYLSIYNCVKVLDLDLDLRTVRFKYWKSGGDMRLYYREAPRKKEGKEGEGGRGNGGEGGEQDRKGEEKTDSNGRSNG